MSFTGVHIDLCNGLQWQHGFEPFLEFGYKCQSPKLPNRKTTDKFIMYVAAKKAEKLTKLITFFIKSFCNLTSRSSIIFCRLSQKKIEGWYYLAGMVG